MENWFHFNYYSETLNSVSSHTFNFFARQDQHEDLIILEIINYTFLSGHLKSLYYYVLQQSAGTVTNDTVLPIGVCASQLKINIRETPKSR